MNAPDGVVPRLAFITRVRPHPAVRAGLSTPIAAHLRVVDHEGREVPPGAGLTPPVRGVLG
jgi:hypothetical protein